MHDPGANSDESSGVPPRALSVLVVSVPTALEDGRVAAGAGRGVGEPNSCVDATIPITMIRSTRSTGARP